MKASLTMAVVALVLGLVVSCGNSSHERAALRSEVQSAGNRDVSGGTCGGLPGAAHQVQYFTSALGRELTPVLRRLWGGRFGWFSINDWPTSSDDTFVAYSPAKAIAFVSRNGGLRINLKELAVSGLRQGGYVDVSYSGYVGEEPGGTDEERIGLLGKGALNCDGTIRVWSMAVKKTKAEAFSACAGAPDRHVNKLAVCKMS